MSSSSWNNGVRSMDHKVVETDLWQLLFLERSRNFISDACNLLTTWCRLVIVATTTAIEGNGKRCGLLFIVQDLSMFSEKVCTNQ